MPQPHTSEPSANFQLWARGFSGCGGGDIGSSERRSNWFCGLEWGGGHTAEALVENFSYDVTYPPTGIDDPSDNTAYRYNQNVVKLITAMNGGDVADYRSTADKLRPFITGSQGFFKLNLFPIAFANTAHSLWSKEIAALTNFPTKYDYLRWCREHRFAAMKAWVNQYQPRVIVCFGKTYVADFMSAFGSSDIKLTSESMLDRTLTWGRSSNGSLIAVCPFPMHRYGLSSNKLLQAFGERLKQLMAVTQ